MSRGKENPKEGNNSKEGELELDGRQNREERVLDLSNSEKFTGKYRSSPLLKFQEVHSLSEDHLWHSTSLTNPRSATPHLH